MRSCRLPVFLVLVFLLCTLFGCVEEMAVSDRLACLDLASYSSAKLPDCSSQEECLKLVEEEFSFDDELFSASVRKALHEYKNRVARSWLYYNRAMANIRAVYSICFKSKNASELAPQLNELNHNLVQAFSELDAAAQLSFSIIMVEKAELERQDIERMKEEALFRDYININSNINELALGSANTGSASYAARYFSAVDSFNSLSAKIGFREMRLQQFSSYDLISSYDRSLLELLTDNKFNLPLVGDAIHSIILWLSSFHDVGEAASVMRHFPAFEVINSFNDFAGVENSVVRSFAALMNSNQLHRKELAARNSELKQKNEQLFSEIELKISAIDSDYYAPFDSAFLSELHNLVGGEAEIVVQQHPIDDLSAFREDARRICILLRQRQQRLLEAEFLGNISLGRKTAELKGLHSELLLLNERIDFFGEEVLSGLRLLCESRVALIEKKLAEDNSPDQIMKLAGLKAELAYKIKKFNSASNLKESLLICRPIIEGYGSFSEALADFQGYEAGLGGEIDACLKYVEQLFPISPVSLASYSYRFKLIKMLETPYENPHSVMESCAALREEMEGAILASTPIGAITKNHLNSRDALDYLGVVSQLCPEAAGASAIMRLKEKFAAEGEFFDGDKLKLLDALPVASELNLSSGNLQHELEVVLFSAIKGCVIQNAKIEFFSSDVPKIDEEYSARLKISMSNSLREISRPLELELPLSRSMPLELVYATPNVQNAFLDANRLHVLLSRLPLGPTVLIFDSNSVLASSSIHSEIVFIDAAKAIIKKQLTVLMQGLLPELIVEIDDAALFNDVFIYSRGEQIDFYRKASSIVFSLQNVENGSQVQIYYSHPQPIQYNFELISQEQIDLNTIRHEYRLQIKNKLDSSIQETDITIPFPIIEEGLQLMELFSSNGTKLSIAAAPPGMLSFRMPSLPPNQQKELYLKLEFRDYTDYWHSVLDIFSAKLDPLAASPSSETATMARQLLHEVKALHNSAGLRGGSGVERIIKIGQEIETLKARDELAARSGLQYRIMKGETEAALASIKEDVDSLRENGFDDYASALDEAAAKVRAILLEAEQQSLLGDINSALLSLFSAKEVISSKPESDVTIILASEKDRLLAGAKELFSMAQGNALNDQNIQRLGEKILYIEGEISAAIMHRDFASANEGLDLLRAEIRDYNRIAWAALLQKATKMKEDINSFDYLVGQAIPQNINVLASMLSAVEEKALLAAAYVPPLTKEELNKIKIGAANLDGAALRAEFTIFLDHFARGDYNRAILVAKGFEEELRKKLGEAASTNSALSRKISVFREDAVVSFNSAIIKFNNAMRSAEAEELLSRARQELEKQNYAEAIMLSNKASSLLSLADKREGFSIPLAVYPFVMIIAAVVYFKWRGRKSRQQLRMQKIIRNR